MGECIGIVMDSSLGEWGMALRANIDKYLHCWVRLIDEFFCLHTKTHHCLCGTIPRNCHGRCRCDNLLGQSLRNHLRSWVLGSWT